MIKAPRLAQLALALMGLLFAGLLGAQSLPELEPAPHHGIRLVNVAEFAVTDQMTSPAELSLNRFRPLTPADVARGLSDQVYWLRFSVLNTSDSPKSWVFHGDSNYLDTIQVFFRDRALGAGSPPLSAFSEHRVSDQQPFDSRMLGYRKLAYAHTTAPGAATDLYIAVNFVRVDAMRLDFSVYDRAYFDERTRTEYLLFGAWYGVLLILLFCSVMTAVVMHNRSAWHYAGFIVATGLMWALLNGLGFQYLWPGNIYLQNQGIHLSYLLFAFFAFQFSRSFLRLADILPTLNRAMWLAQGVMLAGIVLRFFGVHLWVLITSYVALAATVALPLIGMLAWQRGVRHARWFSLAWLIYSMTLVLAVLNAATSFPGWNMDRALAFVQAGTIIEALLLMVAIGERVLQIEHDRRAALDMAHQDPLTGLGNRRRLVEAYEQLGPKFAATGQPVYLGLLDLDEFKAINDRYGHEAGDTILRHLADVLQQHSRGEDICIRYGGDEFVLLVQADNVQAVEQLVERVRKRFSEWPTLYAGQMIRHTLSAGVITAIDQDITLSPEDMLMKVDLALYEAKSRGRNRTIVHS